MDSFETIAQYVQELKPVRIKAPLLQKIVSLMDLTSLNASDTEASIAQFCEKAQTTYGHVAAVCVYPKFVRMIAAEFAGTPIKAVTVANFPEGSTALETVLIEIGRALEDGTQELDIVFPYARYLAGDSGYAEEFVEACKSACGDSVTLKIILETGAFPNLATIAEASHLALTHGADFIKTSTGKTAQGATLEAAAAILLVIRDAKPEIRRRAGFKAAGGIKNLEEAAHYIQLADKIMGPDWVKPQTFRIGTSRLMDEVLQAKVI